MILFMEFAAVIVLIIIAVVIITAIISLIVGIILRKHNMKGCSYVAFIPPITVGILIIMTVCWLNGWYPQIIDTPNGLLVTSELTIDKYQEYVEDGMDEELKVLLDKNPKFIYVTVDDDLGGLDYVSAECDRDMIQTFLDHGAVYDDSYFFDSECEFVSSFDAFFSNSGSRVPYDFRRTIEMMITNGAQIIWQDDEECVINRYIKNMCFSGTIIDDELVTLEFIIENGGLSRDTESGTEQLKDTCRETLSQSAAKYSIPEDDEGYLEAMEMIDEA